MLQRRPLLSLALIVLAPVLASCQRQQADASVCQIPLPATSTKVTVISYESHGMPFFADQMTKCSRGTLSVRHQMLPYDELVSQATISMSAKAPSPYDIIHVYDQLLVEWAGKGWLAPLDDLVHKYWNQYRLDEIPPKLWEMMKVNGHVYAIQASRIPRCFFIARTSSISWD
jgi:ABC-type glycerol-3-phosphate transport system substrate-binding protein